MWSTRDELEAALRQAGLGVWAPRPAAPAQHAVILELGPVEERGEVPIGASRLGGMPDLPPDMSWPWRPPLAEGSGVFKDHAARPWPLSFVAHIDFAEIQSAGGFKDILRWGGSCFSVTRSTTRGACQSKTRRARP